MTECIASPHLVGAEPWAHPAALRIEDAAIGDTASGSDGRKIGLALSAGAALGLAHVGALEALEAEGIPIDCIAGTSMGAVIGALYASGYRASDIESMLGSVDWRQIFSRSPERPLVPLALRIDLIPAVGRVGLTAGGVELPGAIDSDYRVNRLLIELLTGPGIAAQGCFDSLAIPFRAVAADLETGERVIMDRGSLARAVRASMAIPVLLPPVQYGERTLVDGGIVDDLPVDVVRTMGADFVIGVDARLPPLPPERYRDAVEMALKVVDVLARAHSSTFSESADLLIAPDLTGTDTDDYRNYAHITALGREAAAAALAANGGRLRHAPARDSIVAFPTAVSIAEVRIEGNRAVREELIRETFGVRLADRPIDLERVLCGMDALHATRLFDSIWVDFSPAGNDSVGTAAMATVQVKETLPWSFDGGVSYTEADQVGGFVRLRNRNLAGFGESLAITGAASDSELRACGQIASNRLFTPAIGYYARAWVWEDKPRIFAAHDPVGRADFDRWGAVAGLQRTVGPAILFRAGARAEHVESRAPLEAAIDAARERVLSVEGLAAWDRLEDSYFPASGFSTTISGVSGAVSDLETGRSSDYWQVAGSGRAARSIGGRMVLDLTLLAGVSGGDVPAHELFRIGGPLVPGLYREELWDSQAAGSGLTCRVLLWKSLHLAASMGAGNAWPDWDAATFDSLHRGFGLALESPSRIGPMSLMWGRGDDGESRIYFTAGYRHYPMNWLRTE